MAMRNTLWIILLFGVVSVHAAQDVALEQRVQRLSEELRCLVCQNQSLADSHADLAIDLKNQVREKFRQGASEADVIAFMTERYGDFVLYRPPVDGKTWLLWFGPFCLFIGGVIMLWLMNRRRTINAQPTAPINAEVLARADAMLKDE